MKTTLSKIIGSALLATGVAFTSTSFAPANAATLSTTFNEFTGDDATAEMLIQDVTYNGKQAVQFDITVLETENNSGVGTGDIRGFFFDILNNSLLANLGVVGTNLDIQSLTKSADNVSNTGGGNNINGGGSSYKFDVGFGLGTSGASGGIVSQTSFTVFNTAFDLTTSEFIGQEFGLRLQTTGANGQGSSKLLASGITEVVTPPPTQVPEPATLVGLGLAFGGMLASRRRQSH